MEIEQQLRDFLKDLLDGGHSPVKFTNRIGMLNYINDHTSEIGDVHCIELSLSHEKDYYFPETFSIDLIDPSFTNYTGEYEILNEFWENYNDKKTSRLQNFFTKEELSDRSLHVTGRAKPLYRNIIRGKGISEFDVQRFEAIAFNKTCKFMIYTFKTKYSTLSFDELRYAFYEIYLRTEYGKLQVELEKYFDKPYYVRHIGIFNFFCEKFLELKNDKADKNIAKCYGLIYNETKKLSDHLSVYFNVKSLKSSDNEKLYWDDTLDKFIGFFDHLIKQDKIQYDGKKNPYAIFSILLAHFQFDNKLGEVSINLILPKLNFISVGEHTQKIEMKKLNYKGSRSQFAEDFGSLLKYGNNEKSSLLLNGKSKREPIIKKLYKLFSIKSENPPYTEIDVESLITAFHSLNK